MKSINYKIDVADSIRQSLRSTIRDLDFVEQLIFVKIQDDFIILAGDKKQSIKYRFYKNSILAVLKQFKIVGAEWKKD